MRTSNCRSCEAPIIWTRTRTGKKMPVDADPVPDGTFHILEVGDEVEAHHVSAGTMPEGEGRYTSHFATCPDAGKFRK